MPKIRSYEEFSDSLQSEKAWRRKEIITLSTAISDTKGPLQEALIRASLALIYAHWEGFIKNAAESYLIYISYLMKGKLTDPKNTNSHILALTLWGAYKNKNPQDKATPKKYIEAIKDVFDAPHSEFKIPTHKVVQTESNLNYRVLCDICSLIDIDSNPFELKQKLIDEDLLKSRNDIAHGTKVYITQNEFDRIKDQVLDLIELFYNLLDNSVVQKKYLTS